MRAKLPTREPEWLQKWEEQDLYHRIQEARADAPLFVLHDGPPYANGDIHLGHSLNKVLKDVIVRYKTMKGFRSPYIPGWDCHGLPIEQQVIKKLGKKFRESSPIEVRKLCHDYANKYVDIQREQFKRLGVMGDWEKPYLTHDPQYEVGILKVFRELVERGYVRKGLKCVHWDPVFRTALAEAEIEYETHTSDSIYVKFPLRNSENYDCARGLANLSLVIWTTTPWTLPANVGVCLHPSFDYVAVRAGDEHFVVAKELAEKFIESCSLEGAEIVREFKAAELERAECGHPIFDDRASVVILGRHVTLEAGTGCVHTAPGHGVDDFFIGKQYDLPIVMPVDDGGRYTADFAEMEGVSVFDANPKIVEKLRESGVLVASSKITHEYPYSWRSHKPIIFRATEQWFMELDEGKVRERALEAIDNDVQWIPTWGHDRIKAMVTSRPDWCLSRQRAWGVPIPSIRSKQSGDSILDLGVMEKFIELTAEQGTDCWFTEPVVSFLPEGFTYEPTGENKPEDFEKEWDILDVWFDSGASHVAVLEQDERVRAPADIYLEGSDQHRGWFQSSLLTSIGIRERAPYRAVLTHGFLLDGKGHAMSKSKGNVDPPKKVIEQRGADVLRLWVCSEDYQNDLAVSDEILSRVADAYRRIRNTLRFLIGNLEDFDVSAQTVEHSGLEEIDRWILSRLANLISEVEAAFDAYEFHRVYHLIYHFCNIQLSTIYLDVIKDRLYCSAPDDATRRAAQTTMRAILEALTSMLAPILVFTAEEVHEFAGLGSESVHLGNFPTADPAWSASELEDKWLILLALRDTSSLALEESRREKTIGHNLDAELDITGLTDADADFLSENLALLKELLIVSDVRVARGDGGKRSERKVEVTPSENPKCERCWMRTSEMGRDSEHPGLCPRCSDVMKKISTD